MNFITLFGDKRIRKTSLVGAGLWRCWDSESHLCCPRGTIQALEHPSALVAGSYQARLVRLCLVLGGGAVGVGTRGQSRAFASAKPLLTSSSRNPLSCARSLGPLPPNLEQSMAIFGKRRTKIRMGEALWVAVAKGVSHSHPRAECAWRQQSTAGGGLRQTLTLLAPLLLSGVQMLP